MTLSVTSAPNTLALLQALSLPAGQPPSSTSVGSSPASLAATSQPATSQPATSQPASVTSALTAGDQSLFTLTDGVAQAMSTADAADAAGQGVLSHLHQMRAAAGQAADPSASDSDRAALDRRFQASAGQIAGTLAAATVNGANLVDGSLGAGLKVALGQGATASLTPVDLTLGGSTLGLSASGSIATADGAASAHASLGDAIGAAGAGLSTLQAQADQISAHAGFVQTLGQALAVPDTDGDSARLMALQVSQQLSAQPSAIANATPQAILSLFR